MRRIILALLLFGVIAAGLFLLYRYMFSRGGSITRSRRLMTWLSNAQARPEWSIHAGQRCGAAPFIMPTAGYIGFLWDDSFRPGHRHQGLDIFGGTDVNLTPVVAAYSGYLTREPDWKSSVIIRIPSDPLNPGRQIWTYYTHMADSQGNSFVSSQYPPGASEVYVEAGDLLGYQGNYSGAPGNPTGVHLHFSIVQDDGGGGYRNELKIENTLDPSPYLGLPLNAQSNPDGIPVCPSQT